MSYDLQRFIQLKKARGEKIRVLNGIIFYNYNHSVMPFAPLDQDCKISRKEASMLLKDLGGIMVRCTDGIKNEEQLPWYAVICDQFQSMEQMPAKRRNEIKKGLAASEVRRISTVEIADHGYDILHAAWKSYGEEAVITKEAFTDMLQTESGFEDILHYWGIYTGGVLTGFAKCYVFGTTEVNITSVKLHPDHLRQNISDVLYYTLSEYYLGGKRTRYINDGFRNVYHATRVQEKLLTQFNRRKAHTGLHLYYTQPLGMIVKSTYPFRKIFGKLDARLNAIYKLEEAAE